MKTKKTVHTFTPEQLKVTRWDASEFLDSEEAIQGYLEVSLEDPNPRIFIKALGNVAKARGMMALARQTGLSRENLYRSFNGTCNPGFESVWKIARALGFDMKLEPSRAAKAEKQSEKAVAKPAAKPGRGAALKPLQRNGGQPVRLSRNGGGNGNGRRVRKSA